MITSTIQLDLWLEYPRSPNLKEFTESDGNTVLWCLFIIFIYNFVMEQMHWFVIDINRFEMLSLVF